MNRPQWLDPAMAGFMDVLAAVLAVAVLIALLLLAFHGFVALLLGLWGAP